MATLNEYSDADEYCAESSAVFQSTQDRHNSTQDVYSPSGKTGAVEKSIAPSPYPLLFVNTLDTALDTDSFKFTPEWNPASAPVSEFFDMVFDARKLMGTAIVCFSIPGYEHVASSVFWEATKKAFFAGYAYPEERLPLMFEHEHALTSAFKYAQEKRHLENELRKKFAECTSANDPYGFPKPEALVERLLEGETVNLCGHTLAYDADLVWCTNQLGAQGVLGEEPDLPMMQGFLADMLHGKSYSCQSDSSLRV